MRPAPGQGCITCVPGDPAALVWNHQWSARNRLGGQQMTAVPRRASRLAAVAVLAAGAVGAVLELAKVDSPARGPLVLLFLVAAPALAVAGLLPEIHGLARLVVAVAAAIVIDALVAIVMLATGGWSARAGLLAVAVICAACLVAQLPPVRARLARRSRPAGEPAPGDGGEPSAAAAGDAVTAQFSPVRPARPAAQWARASGGAPAGANGGAPARPADEATVQMPAVVREPAADAAAQYPTADQPQPGADGDGQRGPADDRAGGQRPSAGRARPQRQPAGRAASHGPAAVDNRPAGDDDSSRDEAASTDDATLQFPAIRGDE
jgi:hypothetical protein